MSDVIIGAFIADIHIDAGDPDIVYNQLKTDFIGNLKKLPILDLIVIGGDTYHSKIGLESRASKLSMRFFNKDLINISHEKNAGIRVIKGTLSHDNNQLDNLLYLEDRDDVDFKIINHVWDENFRGFNMLYIPEEYIKDRDDYYSKYMKKEYDMAFGHGMFEKVAFSSDDSETQMNEAPIFPNAYFKKNVNGPVLFGHIHTMTKVNDQVWYPGSFHRWVMGQEKKKGFFIFVYNKKTHKYLVLPVYNKEAKKYITLDLDPYLKYPVESILATINNTIESERVMKLRLNISYSGDNVNKLANINIIKEYFSGKRNVDVNIANPKLKKVEKKKRDVVEKHKYIFDKDKSIEEKLSIFINSEFNYKIDKERIDNILHNDILDLD